MFVLFVGDFLDRPRGVVVVCRISTRAEVEETSMQSVHRVGLRKKLSESS